MQLPRKEEPIIRKSARNMKRLFKALPKSSLFLTKKRQSLREIKPLCMQQYKHSFVEEAPEMTSKHAGNGLRNHSIQMLWFSLFWGQTQSFLEDYLNPLVFQKAKEYNTGRQRSHL